MTRKRVRLEYKSLTKEIVDYYLSHRINDDEKQRKVFLTTISKFDVRIATKHVIKGDEFYYKIWILRRRTKERAYIKEYYPLHTLNQKVTALE